MNKYEHIFDITPIAIWEENWEDMKNLLDPLRKNIDPCDLMDYLNNHPQFVNDLAKSIKIIRVNKKAIEMYEAENESQLKSSITDTFCIESFTTFKEEIVALYRGDKEFEFEACTKTLKGNKIYSIITIRLPLSQEEYNNVILTMIDITPNKISQKKYMETKNKFHRSFYEGVVAMIVIDLAGNIIDANAPMCEMLDYTKEEIEGMNISGIEYGTNDYANRDMSCLFRKELNYFRGERPLRKKNGECVWSLVGLNLLRDEDDNPIYFVGQAIDIDKNKKNAIALKENINKYQQLLDYTSTIYAILNEEGEIIDYSSTFLKMFSCNHECLDRKPIRAMVSTESIPVFDEAWSRICKGQTVNCAEISLTKGKIFKWVSFNASMMKNGDVKVFLLMSDITDRKKREFEKLIEKEKHRDRLRDKIRDLRNKIGLIGA